MRCGPMACKEVPALQFLNVAFLKRHLSSLPSRESLAFGKRIESGFEVAKVEGEQSNRMVDDFSRAKLTEGLST